MKNVSLLYRETGKGYTDQGKGTSMAAKGLAKQAVSGRTAGGMEII